MQKVPTIALSMIAVSVVAIAAWLWTAHRFTSVPTTSLPAPPVRPAAKALIHGDAGAGREPVRVVPTYAPLFNRPRLNEPEEKTLMQEAYERIVARRNLQIPLEKQNEIARIFHDLEIWKDMWFLGVPIQKNPCDLWMMQQIIYETKPEVIVEAGTFRGGSALYFAQALQSSGLDASKVITIDIENTTAEAASLPLWKKHVQFIHGSSTDPMVVKRIRKTCEGKRVLVVLDSVHSKDHVLRELEAYAPLVSVGSYVIVEDTNSDGVPIFPGEVGPTAAVEAFLATPLGAKFQQDVSREAMVLTFNPGGWLRRTE